MLRLTLICDAGACVPPGFADDPPLAAGTLRPVTLPPMDAAWSSPARRALQTAALLGLAPTVAAALRDCDHGRWRGRTLAEIARQEPDALAAWVADPDAAPHGGESVSAVARRVGSWLDERCGDRGELVAVTHGVVIRAAIARALGASLAACARIDVPPLCRTLLTGQGGGWRLRAHGC